MFSNELTLGKALLYKSEPSASRLALEMIWNEFLDFRRYVFGLSRCQSKVTERDHNLERGLLCQMLGDANPGSILIPTGQLLRPAGAHITVNDCPPGMALSPDRRTLAVTIGSNFNSRVLHLIEVAGKALIQTMLLKDGFVGVAFHHAGDSIYVGGNGNDDVLALKRRVGRLLEAPPAWACHRAALRAVWR
jgi:hypothetical protein